jgi:hypothetical protein
MRAAGSIGYLAHPDLQPFSSCPVVACVLKHYNNKRGGKPRGGARGMTGLETGGLALDFGPPTLGPKNPLPPPARLSFSAVGLLNPGINQSPVLPGAPWAPGGGGVAGRVGGDLPSAVPASCPLLAAPS